MPSDADRRLEFVEILEVAPPAPAFVEEVRAELARRLGVPCRVGARPDVAIPHLTGRDQVDADRLLERLEQLDGPPGRVVVGLTKQDIGHPIFTHFFGRARHFGAAVLVSAARLVPTFYGLPEDAAVAVRRTVLEVLHELGHVAGLGHCEDWSCLMRYAATVDGIDNRGEGFCADCKEAIPDGYLGLDP